MSKFNLSYSIQMQSISSEIPVHYSAVQINEAKSQGVCYSKYEDLKYLLFTACIWEYENLYVSNILMGQ